MVCLASEHWDCHPAMDSWLSSHTRLIHLVTFLLRKIFKVGVVEMCQRITNAYFHR